MISINKNCSNRCHQWAELVGRYDLMMRTAKQLKNCYLCGDHFDRKMFLNFERNRLHSYALPMAMYNTYESATANIGELCMHAKVLHSNTITVACVFINILQWLSLNCKEGSHLFLACVKSAIIMHCSNSGDWRHSFSF
jgi:hypothetical protein